MKDRGRGRRIRAERRAIRTAWAAVGRALQRLAQVWAEIWAAIARAARQAAEWLARVGAAWASYGTYVPNRGPSGFPEIVSGVPGKCQ
jgi:hypothetical protein